MARNAAVSAYSPGALALLGSIGIILAALAFEHLGGFRPCELCLAQRWAYYVGIPLLFVGLVLLSGGFPRAASIVFLLVALAFLANAGLAASRRALYGHLPEETSCYFWADWSRAAFGRARDLFPAGLWATWTALEPRARDLLALGSER